MTETWAPAYEVSDQGRFRSWKRHRLADEPRYPEGSPNKNGYIEFKLSKNGRKRHFTLGILVRLANLRWDTQAGNMADKLTHGTKLTNAEAEVVRRLKGHVPSSAVGRALVIDPVNIRKLWDGVTYDG